MYDDAVCQMRVDNGFSEEFNVRAGVYQVSALSLLLSIVGLQPIAEELKIDHPWELLYSDKLDLILQFREESERKFHAWKLHLRLRDF